MMARMREARLYWINLECENEEEHLRRGKNVERARYLSKITDPRRILEVRKSRLLQASDCYMYNREGEPPLVYAFRSVQVASQGVNDTVTEILSFLTQPPPPPKTFVERSNARPLVVTLPQLAADVVDDDPLYDRSLDPWGGPVLLTSANTGQANAQTTGQRGNLASNHGTRCQGVSLAGKQDGGNNGPTNHQKSLTSVWSVPCGLYLRAISR